MKVIVAGGSGFIGRAVVDALAGDGHEVILLTRTPHRFMKTVPAGVTVRAWDGRNPGPWVEHLNGAGAVVNLSGEGIAEKKWTRERKELLVASRLEPTRALVRAMGNAFPRPPVLINASAVGYYGNVTAGGVPETSGRGSGFLADVCEMWEKEARQAEFAGARVVLLRTGIVLDKDGGALKKMLPAFRAYLGGPLGSGCQWFPWVHRDDAAGAVLFALKNKDVWGPVNVAAPEAVTLRDFCSFLGKTLGRPSWFRVPAFALRLGLGEMSEILLSGQRAVPRKLVEAGYEFKYPQLDAALSAILKNPV